MLLSTPWYKYFNVHMQHGTMENHVIFADIVFNKEVAFTNNDENSKVISYSSNEGDIYTKKFDTKLSGNVGISVSTSNDTDKKYIVFYMTFTNIFEGNDYDIIIPILNEKY